MKRLLSFLFTVALVIGLMPSIALGETGPAEIPATNAGQITAQGGNNPSDGGWHTGEGGGQVKVSKTISETGIENYFDITLTVDAKEVAKNTSTAIVLVMDVSNTMNTDNRLANAKQAANQFIDEFCTGEGLSPDRYLGIVTFNTNAQWANGLTLQKVDASSASTLKSKVNNITAPKTPDGERFTNMEAGLQLAYNVLSSQQVANKYIIFITDGFPTTYINRTNSNNANSTTKINGWNPYETDSWQASKVGTDGYFADSVYKVVCSAGTSYSDKAAIRARELATVMKSNNINIFSVGIDIGGQTIKEYVDGSSSSLSVVDRTGTKYEIGDASNSQAYARWLGNSIAGGPKLTAQAHRYAAGNNPQQLKVAFDNILADIKAVTSLPMTDAFVVDPMGGQVEFQYFYSIGGSPAAKLEGESLLNAENTASYNNASDSISWNIMESGLKEIKTDSSTGARTVNYSLTYRVRLENELSTYAHNTIAKTNNGATFNYQTANPNGSSTHNDPLVFPDPKVRGYKGSFSFTKVELDAGGTIKKVLPGAVFELKHDDANCKECKEAKKTVSVDPMYATSNDKGVVSFTGIPSGHDYILLEDSAPIGYQLSSTEYPVNVSYGATKVNGEVWNADTNNPALGATVSNTHLLPCEVDFVVSKSLYYGNSQGDPAEAITPDHGAFTFELQRLDTRKDDSSDPTKITGFSINTGSKDNPLIYQSTLNHGTAAEFKTIHFETVGDYYYRISEAADSSKSDLHYDDAYYIARIAVGGTSAGHTPGNHLTSKVTIWKFTDKSLEKAALDDAHLYSDANLVNSGEDANKIMFFTNVKSKPVTVELPAISKTLDGNSNLTAGQFSFQLIDSKNNVLQTVTNNATGEANFQPLTFDTAGEYTYTIKEVVGNDTSIYYDETVYKVAINVTKPADNSGLPYTAKVITTANGQELNRSDLPFANTTKNGFACHACNEDR